MSSKTPMPVFQIHPIPVPDNMEHLTQAIASFMGDGELATWLIGYVVLNKVMTIQSAEGRPLGWVTPDRTSGVLLGIPITVTAAPRLASGMALITASVEETP